MQSVSDEMKSSPIVSYEKQTFTERIDLAFYSCRRIRFSQCTFEQGLDLSGLECSGDVEIENCLIYAYARVERPQGTQERRDDAISLKMSRARIKGRLNMRGTLLAGPKHAARRRLGRVVEGGQDLIHRLGDFRAPGLVVGGCIDATNFMWDAHNWSSASHHGTSRLLVGRAKYPESFPHSVPFRARHVELPDSVLHGRVDFGGAKVKKSFRMTRTRIEGSLNLEWRPHSHEDHGFWITNRAELRTEIGGRLDLDKVRVTGSIMARGIRVVSETILSGAEIGGAVNFRAWHISEREENGLKHTRWISRGRNDPCLRECALSTELLGGFYGRHIQVGTLLNLTGAQVGAHGTGMTSQDAVNLDSSQIGFLSIATWRHHGWSEYSRKPNETYRYKEYEGYHLPSVIHGAVRLTDARVSSSVRMNGAQIDGRLIANGLKVAGNVDLSSFVAITTEGPRGWLCNIPLEIGKGVHFFPDDSESPGERAYPIVMNGRQMRIGGALEFDGSVFHGGIRVDGLTAGKVTLDVRGGAGGEESSIWPTVVKRGKIVHHEWSFKMHHGKIAGTFSMRGAQMESGVSLYASEIRGGIQAGPTKIGEKLFRTAIGKGGTEIHYAKPKSGNGLRSDNYSLYIAHAKVGGDVCLDAPALAGPLQAEGAVISGSLTMRALKVDPLSPKCPGTDSWWVVQWPMPGAVKFRDGVDGNAIVLSNVTVGQSLEITGLRIFPDGQKVDVRSLPQNGIDLRGEIDLKGAKVGTLDVSWHTDPATTPPRAKRPRRARKDPKATPNGLRDIYQSHRDLVMQLAGGFCGAAPAVFVAGGALLLSQELGDFWGSIYVLATGVLLWTLWLVAFTIRESAHSLRANLFAVDGLSFDSIQASPVFEEGDAKPTHPLPISPRILFSLWSGLGWSTLLALSWPRWQYKAVDEMSALPLHYRIVPFIGENWLMCAFILMLWLTVLHRYLIDRVARGAYRPNGFLDRCQRLLSIGITEATNDRNLRTFLLATKFDAAFYSRVEKWLQKEGNRAGAGRVTRTLQRRLIQQSLSPNLPSAIGSIPIHILFGHGTRLWPSVVSYALFAINGYHVFSDPRALKVDDALRTQRMNLALHQVQASDAVWNATKLYLNDDDAWLPDLNALRKEARTATIPAGAAVDKALPFGSRPGLGRDALGPILRAAIPFASFALKDDLTYSDRSIEISLKAPVSKIFVIPNRDGEKRVGLTYAEYAAILTIMGWILLPIFLVKLVSQMRRLEVRDFEE